MVQSDKSEVIFSGHAIQRMFERQITKRDVLSILSSGVTIEEYPAEEPLPKKLLMGYSDGRRCTWCLLWTMRKLVLS